MPRLNTTEVRMVKIETDITYIKEGIDEIKSVVKDVPKIYATKDEVKSLEAQVVKNSGKLWDTALKVAYALGILATLYIGIKGGV